MISENTEQYKEALNRLFGDSKDIEKLCKFIEEYNSLIHHLKTTRLYDIILFEENSIKFTKESLEDLYWQNNKLKEEINKLRRELKKTEKYKVN